MKRLIVLCLLSPAIFAQSYKTRDPNDEPFLPIHPVYPYSPKLIKRGTEGEINSQLTSELYAPKVDAKDTYSSSYSNNYQRDSYYPDHHSYPTNNTPSFNYPSYYNGETYIYPNTPYHVYNSYPAPYVVNPVPYPNYYYQPPYYYPHYITHALFPPPSPSGVDYYETSQVPIAENNKQEANKKDRTKEDEMIQDAPANQFVDGGNYIADNSRDLDVQSSTHKVANPYNQLAQNVAVKNVPILLPKASYRVINVEGQPGTLNYPLPTAYIKAQQIETNQALTDLLAQNARQQSDRSYENIKDTSNNASDGLYEHQGVYNPNQPSYVTLPSTKSKTDGVSYVIESVGIIKGEPTKHQSSASQRNPIKNIKHSNAYSQKLTSRNYPQAYISLENRNNQRARVSSGRLTGQTSKYDTYDASQSYNGTYNQFGNKQEQNYGPYQSQPGSYQNDSFTVTPQTSRMHSYQYSAYESEQIQQPQQSQTNTENFGIKQYKG